MVDRDGEKAREIERWRKGERLREMARDGEIEIVSVRETVREEGRLR